MIPKPKKEHHAKTVEIIKTCKDLSLFYTCLLCYVEKREIACADLTAQAKKVWLYKG